MPSTRRRIDRNAGQSVDLSGGLCHTDVVIAGSERMSLILQITDKPDPGGGIRRVVEDHAALLGDLGHERRVLRLVHGGDRAGNDPFNVAVADARGRGADAAGLATLRQAARGADLIHLHLGFTALSPEFIATAAALAPLIVNLHDIAPFLDLPLAGIARPTDPDRGGGLARLHRRLRRPRRRALWQALCDNSALILAPSRYLHDLARAAGAPADKLRILPHALPHALPQALPEAALPPSACPPLILFAGRLSPAKGAPILLEAVARVTTPGAELAICGAGPDEQALRATARARGIAGRVTFLGELPQQRLFAAMAGARCLAYPSLVPEGFGLAGIEAMSLGRPVVGFGGGGSDDWLVDGETGLVARHGDSTALARAFERVLSDADLADRLGESARRRVGDAFSRGAIARALGAACAEAMSKRR